MHINDTILDPIKFRTNFPIWERDCLNKHFFMIHLCVQHVPGLNGGKCKGSPATCVAKAVHKTFNVPTLLKDSKIQNQNVLVALKTKEDRDSVLNQVSNGTPLKVEAYMDWVLNIQNWDIRYDNSGYISVYNKLLAKDKRFENDDPIESVSKAIQKTFGVQVDKRKSKKSTTAGKNI